MLNSFAIRFAPRVEVEWERNGLRFLTLAASARMLVAHLDGVSTVLKRGHILLAKYRICLVNALVNPQKLSKLSSM